MEWGHFFKFYEVKINLNSNEKKQSYAQFQESFTFSCIPPYFKGVCEPKRNILGEIIPEVLNRSQVNSTWPKLTLSNTRHVEIFFFPSVRQLYVFAHGTIPQDYKTLWTGNFESTTIFLKWQKIKDSNIFINKIDFVKVFVPLLNFLCKKNEVTCFFSKTHFVHTFISL